MAAVRAAVPVTDFLAADPKGILPASGRYFVGRLPAVVVVRGRRRRPGAANNVRRQVCGIQVGTGPGVGFVAAKVARNRTDVDGRRGHLGFSVAGDVDDRVFSHRGNERRRARRGPRVGHDGIVVGVVVGGTIPCAAFGHRLALAVREFDVDKGQLRLIPVGAGLRV